MELSANSGDSYQKSEQEHLAKKQQKFEGFDFFRGLFPLAIVAYKTKLFYLPAILIPSTFTYQISDYVLSGMIGALAVPVFFQISLFLFYYKSEKTDFSYFLQKRLPRLISLYLFWVGSVTLFDILFAGGIEQIRRATSSLKTFVEFIVSGNSTPYFFFFSLILLTTLAQILIQLFNKIEKNSIKINISYCLLFVTSLFIFTFSALEPIMNATGIQSSLLNLLNNIARWDYTPVNFLPYIFTSAITVQEYKEGKLEKVTKSLKIKLYILLALTLIFFALEWILTSQGLLIQVDQAPLDHYLRVSLIFGSWLLLYLGILLKPTVPPVIKFLSECSLGIYGFHVFFIFKRSYRVLSLSSIPVLANLFQAVPALEIIIDFLVVLFGSIALTLLAKKSKILKRFV